MMLRRILVVLTVLVPWSFTIGVAHDHPLRLLVSTRTTGFRHGSIDAGRRMLDRLASRNAWSVTYTEDATAFRTDVLERTDVVIFCNTTGDVVDDAGQRALEAWIRGGGGFVGIHAAADGEYTWSFYTTLVGAQFRTHPAIQEAVLHVHDRSHPSTHHLGSRWTRTDEWYDFRQRPRDNAHVLVTLDETTYSGGSMGADHPIAWCSTIDAGRSWYTGGGHRSEAYDELDFEAHIEGGIRWAGHEADGDALGLRPQAYSLQTIGPAYTQPLALECLHDGTLLVLCRDGSLHHLNPETDASRVLTTLPLRRMGEDGAVGMACDGRRRDSIVLFVSVADANSGTISIRRTVVDTTLRTSPMWTSIFSMPYDPTSYVHIGGGLAFDTVTGDLYLGTGDNRRLEGLDGWPPLDERPGREQWDAQATSANTNDLRGKILRIRPNTDGTGYSIPPGNLFPAGTAATRPEVYAMGLRNPFRLHVDAMSGTVLFGDVGPDATDDRPSRGPKGRDEVNITDGAGNFGWPYVLADNRPYRKVDLATGSSAEPFDPIALVNNSPNNTGLVNLPPAQPAFASYAYYEPDTALFGKNDGRSIIAGPRVRLPATGRSRDALPTVLEGAWLIADYVRGWIRAVLTDGDRPTTVVPLLYGRDSSCIVDLEQRRDGTVFVAVWRDAKGGHGTGRVARLLWSGNRRPPQAVIMAQPADGALPLTVTFDGRTSEGDVVGWQWDLDGDGTVDDTTAGPIVRTYQHLATTNVRLTVTDRSGRQASTTMAVTAGNTRPRVTIVEPRDGTVLRPGDTRMTVVARCSDNETAEDALLCRIGISLGHDTHAHPTDEADGPVASLAVPGIGDHAADANLYVVCTAVVTDNGVGDAGPLSASASIRLQPAVFAVRHATSTSGFAEVLPGSGDGHDRCLADDGTEASWVVRPLRLHDIERVVFRYRTDVALDEVTLVDADNDTVIAAAGPLPVAASGGTAVVPLPDGMPTARAVRFRLRRTESGTTCVTDMTFHHRALSGLPPQRPTDDGLPGHTIQVRPTPASSQVTLSVPHPCETGTITIGDATGRILRSIAVEPKATAVVMDCRDLAPGWYVVRSQGCGTTAATSMVVVR